MATYPGAVTALPLPPKEYDKAYMDQLIRAISNTLLDMQRFRGGNWPYAQFCGEFNSSTTYTKGMIVSYSSRLFLHIDSADTSIGTSPPEANGWWQLA